MKTEFTLIVIAHSLNSVSNVNKAIPLLKEYKNVLCLLDNDLDEGIRIHAKASLWQKPPGFPVWRYQAAGFHLELSA